MCASPLPSFSTDPLACSTTQNIIPLACWRKVNIRKYMKKLHKLKISCAWAPSLSFFFPFSVTSFLLFQPPSHFFSILYHLCTFILILCCLLISLPAFSLNHAICFSPSVSCKSRGASWPSGTGRLLGHAGGVGFFPFPDNPLPAADGLSACPQVAGSIAGPDM